MPAPHFIAVDIGNARIKLGLFAGDGSAGIPEPLRTLPLMGKEPELDCIEPWLADHLSSPFGRGAGGEGTREERGSPHAALSLASPHPNPLPKGEGTRFGKSSLETSNHVSLTWWIASVNRPAATRLIDWLHEHRPTEQVVLLACGDLPLEVRLERPDMVGIDRLVDAVAVNRLRERTRPAVIVDVGTAITVDLVSADGAFLGGSILPGIQMAARALHHFTDLLPLVNISNLSSPPPALGTSTESAMRAGLFWGAVGAIRQLIEQLSQIAGNSRLGGSSTATPTGAIPTGTTSTIAVPTTSTPAPAGSRDLRPQVFLTGGAAATVADLLEHAARYAPNLTLSGIAEVALARH
jgi:pantothenate kinase type III